MDVFFFTLQMSNKCLTNVQAIDGKFPRFLRYLCNKNNDKLSAICLHFGIFIDCEMSNQIFNFGNKMLDKLFAKTNSFFGNSLHITCPIASRNTSFLPNNCLARVQTTSFIKYFESSQVLCL
jgi:hypothetical protein